MNVREGFQDPEEVKVTAEPSPPRPGPNGGAPAAAPEPVAEPAPPEWPVRVKLLHRPIKNMQNEEVHELVFREPYASDINRYGNPCRITLDGDPAIDEQKMMRIMAALSGILIPNLERMDPRDWNSCAYRLRNFFLPEVAAW
jgi:hypothetical protein